MQNSHIGSPVINCLLFILYGTLQKSEGFDISMDVLCILGLPILRDFKYKGANEWEGGKIYDPKNGKTYSCKMTLQGNTLKVRGFVGISLLGRTTIGTKKI
jgi:uncharacterized protein (DUF2147 family)